MFTVFECRKCGHLLYVEECKPYPKKLERIAGTACPNCGEQSEALWLLRGRARTFPGKIKMTWEDTGNE
jgi:Zn ribbon nucleic-acid-binding protein